MSKQKSTWRKDIPAIVLTGVMIYLVYLLYKSLKYGLGIVYFDNVLIIAVITIAISFLFDVIVVPVIPIKIHLAFRLTIYVMLVLLLCGVTFISITSGVSPLTIRLNDIENDNIGVGEMTCKSIVGPLIINMEVECLLDEKFKSPRGAVFLSYTSYNSSGEQNRNISYFHENKFYFYLDDNLAAMYVKFESEVNGQNQIISSNVATFPYTQVKSFTTDQYRDAVRENWNYFILLLGVVFITVPAGFVGLAKLYNNKF